MKKLSFKPNSFNFLKSFNRFCLDTLFPVSCLSCQKTGEWICSECLKKISLKRKQVCPLCKKMITPDGQTCFECRHQNSIDGVLVASYYRKNRQKTFLAELIHYYKYNFLIDLREPLGEILTKAFLSSKLNIPDIIVPVPLHPRRLRWRGFNQSLLLSKFVAKNLTPGMSITIASDLLLRKKYTQPQMSLRNRTQRIDNLKNVFELNKNSPHFKQLSGKNILLIDDVITTGSTLFECAKTFKKTAKPKSVYGLVLARQ